MGDEALAIILCARHYVKGSYLCLRISSTLLLRPKLDMHSKFIPNVGLHGTLGLLKIILLPLHLSKDLVQNKSNANFP